MGISQLVYESRHLLLKHWPGVVVALIVGLLCVAPPFFFSLSSDYKGVALTGQKDEEHYIARTQQVYAGHPSLGNTFLGQKDLPYLQAGLGENIVARLGMLLGMSTPEITVAGKFLFPFSAALLLYALIYALFSSISVALMGVLWLFFGDNLSSGIRPWIDLLHGNSPDSFFLPFMRPINPEVSSIFFFAALYIFYRGFFERTSPRAFEIVALGLLIATVAYVNPYHFTFLVLFAVVWFLWRLWKKDYAGLVPMVYVGGIVFLALIPFLINYVHLIGESNYAETSVRWGLVDSHAPVIGLWSVLLLICPLFFWPEKYAKAKKFFLLASVAILVLLNQQVITGHLIQQNHYHFYVTKPLADVLLGMYTVFFATLLTRSEKFRTAVLFLAGFFLVYNGALMQYDSYVAAYPDAVGVQRYAPALSYLKTLPAEETVWADRMLSLYIPMYTKHNVPNNFYTSNYLVSNEYLEKRELLEYKLQGVSPGSIREVLENDRGDVSARIFGLHWREKEGSYAAIPDSLLDRYATEYQALFKQPSRQLFKDLGITIIAWDKTVEPTWNIDAFPFAKKEFEDAGVAVYRLQ